MALTRPGASFEGRFAAPQGRERRAIPSKRGDAPDSGFRYSEQKSEGIGVREAAPIRNRVLLAFSADARAFVEPRLVARPLKAGEILFRSGEPLSQAIFPDEGVIDVVARMTDGRRAEMATVGDEGFVGFGLLGDRRAAFGVAIVEAPGRAAWLAAADLIAAREKFDSVRAAISSFRTALIGQLMASAACNSLHSAEQRIARRLLETDDRMSDETFALTQQTLAEALALRRATVGAVCARLQRDGAIRYARGAMAILDRRRLEAAACECYGRIRGLRQ